MGAVDGSQQHVQVGRISWEYALFCGLYDDFYVAS